MTHEQLQECKHNWEEFKRHQRDSIPVRMDVSKHDSQILTLEQAHASTLEDIKAIRKDQGEIKVWVLGGILATIVVFAIPVFQLTAASGRQEQQVERLNKLHPYGISVEKVN